MNVNNYTSLLSKINESNLNHYIGFEEPQDTQGKKVEGGKNLALKDIKNLENVDDELKEAGKTLREDLVNSLKSYKVSGTFMDKMYDKLGIKMGEQELSTPKALTAREFKDAVAVLNEAKSAHEQEIRDLLLNFKGGGFPEEKADFLTKAMLSHSDDSRVKAFLAQPGGNTLMNLVAVCRMALETKDSNANIYAVAYFEGYTSYFSGRMTAEERELSQTKQQREAGQELAQMHDKAAGHPQQVSESQQSPNSQQVQNTESNTQTSSVSDSAVSKPTILAPEINHMNCKIKLEELIKTHLPENSTFLDDLEKWISELNAKIRDNVPSECQESSLEAVKNYCQQIAANALRELGKKANDKLDSATVLNDIKKKVNTDDAVMYILLKDAIDHNTNHKAYANVPGLSDRVNRMLDLNPTASNDDPHVDDFVRLRSSLYNEQKIFGEKFSLRDTLTKLLDAYCVPDAEQNSNDDDEILDNKDSAVNLKDSTVNLFTEEIDTKTVVKQQPGSNLCYMRAPINILISKGVKLNDVCQSEDGGFKFTLPVEVLGSKVKDISVTKDEIENMWNAQCTLHPGQKDNTTKSTSGTDFDRKSFSDFDLALCVATAKLKALQDNKQIAETFTFDTTKTPAVASFNVPHMCSMQPADDVMQLFGYSPDDSDKFFFNQSMDSITQTLTSKSETGEDRLKTWFALSAWKNTHPKGALIINENGGHFIAGTELYFKDKNDFGVICRDSANQKGCKTINLANTQDRYAVTGYTKPAELDVDGKMRKYSKENWIPLDSLKGKSIEDKRTLLFEDSDSFKQFSGLGKDEFENLGSVKAQGNSTLNLMNMLDLLSKEEKDEEAEKVVGSCKNKLAKVMLVNTEKTNDQKYLAISNVIKEVIKETPVEQLGVLAKCHALMLVHYGVDEYRVIPPLGE